MNSSPETPNQNRSPEEVSRLMRQPGSVVIDVREPDEYRQEHIAGAVSLPLSSLKPEQVPQGKQVFLYCGKGQRACKARDTLHQAGLTSLGVIEGGIAGWKAAGLPTESSTPAASCGPTRVWSLLALGLAILGSAGSIYLSVGLGLKACPLCFYQRTFIMGAASILLVMRLMEPRRPGLAACLALPLVVGGLGVAGFHVSLELADKLECPSGVFGLGTAPQQSLAAFSVLFVATVLAAWSGRCESPRQHPLGWLGLLVLGGVMAAASIKSSPPLPPDPTQPYNPATQPLEMCRPPYQGA